MLKTLKRARDRFFGTGEADTSVPVLDGALKPNNLLETAEVFFERPGLEDLAIDAHGQLYVAAGPEVLLIGADGRVQDTIGLQARAQALAVCHGNLVAATSQGLQFLAGPQVGRHVQSFGGHPIQCINALSEGPDGTLLLSEGSHAVPCDEWTADLLTHGRSGRVLAYDPRDDSCRVLAQGLAYCFGVCMHEDGVLASESWAHRVQVLRDGRMQAGLSEIPGYPGRIAPASGGGYWLSIFAPRSQLLEFVLREDVFRKEMMSTVEPRYWIAPAFSSGQDFLEPLQQGSVRQMGILKPWAPPRSYGLVLRLSADLAPLFSMHSRVGGVHHGIVAAQEYAGSLLALSKGSGRLLRLPLFEQNPQA
ncbi:strictosidine synthase [Castellaniella sp.]|uniref:strictosidine synthase n=1 Tax=Castellaniella sp. TaxID=1955812 RepID=UPI00355E7BB3